jgi:soluble lytic murein transglycosylase
VKRFAALGVFAAVVIGVVAFVQYGEPAWLQRLRYPLEYKAIVRAHARNYRLEPALLAAVIYQESKFHPDAKSSSGALGLMQILPSTAQGIALHTGGSEFRVDDLYDPEINIRYGSWYLRHLLDKYRDERTALAAYNAGQTNVDEWQAAGKGIQFSETRHYVSRVEDLKKIYRHAYASDLGD